MPETLPSTARAIRRHLVEMTARSRSSHIGACLSIVDALVVLYFRAMRINPDEPNAPERDRLILSKAHASAALYATLAERGFFPRDLLKGYFVDGGTLPGHLDKTAAPGIESSGGSLGHGLSLGLGMALAAKRDKLPSRVFVLVGDGECNEGSVWEAAMLAPNLQLGNLTVLVDYNKIQSFGRTNEIIDQRNLRERWAAFGWESTDIDGHDLTALETNLGRPPGNRPRAVILHTVKGKGISFMEDQLLWHYRSPSDDERDRALAELEAAGRAEDIRK